MALTLDYALVDVFAEQPLEGNQLAIFTDARGLTTAQMQALARETNLSETTFILPADDPASEHEQGVQVRIFTTDEELRFAGHPTLGTASWLHWHHPTLRGATTIKLALPVGCIPVTFEPNTEASIPGSGVFGTMRQQDPAPPGQVHPPEAIAQALGVSLDDLDLSRPIQTASTGMAFCIVPFRSVETLGRLRSSPAVAQRYLDGSDAKFFYCIAPAEPVAGGADFRTRMQFYNGEDPATGSAAGCAIAYLVQHGYVPSGAPVIFEQGIEMLRPSRLHVRATLAGGKVQDVFVGGRTQQVATGSFRLT